MTVNSILIPSISLSPLDTAICTGKTVVLTAHPANQGSAPVYQWKNNGVITGGNSPTYTINGLTKNTTVTVSLKSNALCARPDTAASAPVIITALPTPDIRISGDTVLVAGAKNFLTATTSYSGPDLQYQWQDSTHSHSWQNISGAAADSINYAPVASGDKIRCVCKTNAGCTATSNPIAMRINTPTALPVIPSVSGDAYHWYPNPVSSTIYIENGNPSDPFSTITVFNNSGIRVLAMNYTGRQAKIAIDVSTLVTGEYFVKLGRNSGKTSYFLFLKVQ
jgi:hypothetical protein